MKPHDRTLPPRETPEPDPRQATLDLDLPPRQTPGPRVVPVRGSIRHNPRHKETHGKPDPTPNLG